MNRRGALVAGVAAAAGAAGVGVSLWRSRAGATSPSGDLWSLRFDRPAGGELSFANLRGRPLLLNFWATWCPPCVAELPLLDRFQAAQAAQGWQVVGLAVDQATPVQAFLAKRPVAFPIGLAGGEGIALSRALGNGTGALPFSVVFDRRGVAVRHRLGAVDPAELAQWVQAVT